MAIPIELTAEDIIPPAATGTTGGIGDIQKIERILKTVDRAITLLEKLPFFQQQKALTVQPQEKYPTAVQEQPQHPPEQPPQQEPPPPPQTALKTSDLPKYFENEDAVIKFIGTVLNAMPPTIKLKEVATLLNQVFAQFGDYTAADGKMMFSAFKPILRLTLRKEFEKVKK